MYRNSSEDESTLWNSGKFVLGVCKARKFVERRVAWLQQRPKPQSSTILVTNIPPSYSRLVASVMQSKVSGSCVFWLL